MRGINDPVHGNVKYYELPLNNYHEIVVALNNRQKPPLREREGPCPRGFDHLCSVCYYIHGASLENGVLRCMDMDGRNVIMRPEDTVTSDDVGNLSQRVHVTYRDLVIGFLDVPFFTDTSMTLIDLIPKYAAIHYGVVKHIEACFESGRITLEKQEVDIIDAGAENG